MERDVNSVHSNFGVFGKYQNIGVESQLKCKLERKIAMDTVSWIETMSLASSVLDDIKVGKVL